MHCFTPTGSVLISTYIIPHNMNRTPTASMSGYNRESTSLRRQARTELVDAQREEIREAFMLFDLNKDGFIDFHELKVALKALGFEKSKQEVLAILRDNGENDMINYEAFYDVTASMMLTRDPIDEIKRAFRLFDIDNKGKILLQDLRRVVKDLGENLTTEEMQGMIDEFDMDDDGYINEAEFIKICSDWAGPV